MFAKEKCSLCNNSSSLHIIFTKTYKKLGKRSYIHCPECDLIFVPGELHISTEDERDRYLLHNNTLSNEGYVNMFKEKIGIIQQHCPDIRSALDYGCGPEPVLAELLRKKGYECDVFDPIFYPDYTVRSYDLVIATEVFEHFRETGKELERICMLLEPGGFLAIMTLLHDHVKDFKNWWYHSDPTHICFFSMKTFEWIADRYGLKIIYSNHRDFIILNK